MYCQVTVWIEKAKHQGYFNGIGKGHRIMLAEWTMSKDKQDGGESLVWAVPSAVCWRALEGSVRRTVKELCAGPWYLLRRWTRTVEQASRKLTRQSRPGCLRWFLCSPFLVPDIPLSLSNTFTTPVSGLVLDTSSLSVCHGGHSAGSTLEGGYRGLKTKLLNLL